MEAISNATANVPLYHGLVWFPSEAAPILTAFLLATALPSIGVLRDFNHMMSQIRYCIAQ
jgi:hypothetical protein